MRETVEVSVPDELGWALVSDDAGRPHLAFVVNDGEQVWEIPDEALPPLVRSLGAILRELRARAEAVADA